MGLALIIQIFLPSNEIEEQAITIVDVTSIARTIMMIGELLNICSIILDVPANVNIFSVIKL